MIKKKSEEGKRAYLMSPSALAQRRAASKLSKGKSTGPKTVEGKKASASGHNWKHGLYAKKFIFGRIGKICRVDCSLYSKCEAIESGISSPGTDCFIQKIQKIMS